MDSYLGKPFIYTDYTFIYHLIFYLNKRFILNIILHKKKPYHKGKSSITLFFFTLTKYDVLDMLDKAAKKVDYLMYTKPMKDRLALQKK